MYENLMVPSDFCGNSAVSLFLALYGKLGSVLHKYFYLLQSNERLKRAFAEPPMVAFRRLKNQKDTVHFVERQINWRKL